MECCWGEGVCINNVGGGGDFGEELINNVEGLIVGRRYVKSGGRWKVGTGGGGKLVELEILEGGS